MHSLLALFQSMFWCRRSFCHLDMCVFFICLINYDLLDAVYTLRTRIPKSQGVVIAHDKTFIRTCNLLLEQRMQESQQDPNAIAVSLPYLRPSLVYRNGHDWPDAWSHHYQLNHSSHLGARFLDRKCSTNLVETFDTRLTHFLRSWMIATTRLADSLERRVYLCSKPVQLRGQAPV